MNLAVRVLSTVVLCLGLAGCFTSKEPLIGPEDAVFPYQTIVFGDAGNPDDRQTWTRKGDAYSFRPDDSEDREASVRLKDIGKDLYVVQMEFLDEDKLQRLFALLSVDLAARHAKSYAAIMPDDFQDLPGLAKCEDVVCIDDLDAYVAYARAAMQSGRPPDAEYRIISLE